MSSLEYYGEKEENYCFYGSFWLKAPYTGDHKFYVTGDDYIELWLNSKPGDASIEYTTIN